MSDISAPNAASSGSSALLAKKASKRISNAIKYRDTGKKPDRGTDGSATLEVRALVAKNGQATIEAMAGGFAQGPVGTIEKVQLKFLTGAPTPTQNFNNLNVGGYWTYTTTRPYGDELEIKAHVTTDKKKTQVVTVRTKVSNLPDVAVTSVNVPNSTVPLNSRLTISAVVRELKNEVGALGNCVLFVDGLQADVAPGIWVDAGGTVSCAFTHTFTKAGAINVRVAVTGLNPGDWDMSNNASSSTVLVEVPRHDDLFEHGSMEISDFNYVAYDSSGRSGPFAANSVSKQTVAYTIMETFGTSMTTLVSPTQDVTATITRNGVQLSRVTLALLSSSNQDDGATFLRCSSYTASGDFADVCVFDDRVAGTHFVSAYYQKMAGSVTYSGREECKYAECDPSATYTWNSADVFGNGVSYALLAGQNVGVAITFGEAAGTVSMNQSVVMTDRSSGFGYVDTGCFDSGDATICYDSRKTGTFTYGFIEW